MWFVKKLRLKLKKQFPYRKTELRQGFTGKRTITYFSLERYETKKYLPLHCQHNCDNLIDLTLQSLEGISKTWDLRPGTFGRT